MNPLLIILYKYPYEINFQNNHIVLEYVIYGVIV